MIKTPLSIGIDLYLHQDTRSKKLINLLLGLNISANYKQVIRLKKDIANSTEMKRQKNNGVFILLGFQQNHPMFFAIDKIDLKVGTSDETNQLHGTAIAAY